ncbi:MAG: aminopeptidase [Bacteroidetes bacterium]|nr:aminopeptidase [Bacteroidota bacterium]MBI3482242.1 aminopeptidase [Bacteroidota bacterium]
MIKKILVSALVIFIALIIWQWSLINYGVRMGYGQLKIIWNSKPVETFLNDPSFPDSLKGKLHLIEEIRKYAIDSLGLKDTENYKTMYDQHDEELMWVVQACEPFELKPKLWHFPFVGDLPYKGFFKKENALAERKKLMNENYDVSVRNPGGWSTLGWFTDPILSGMLRRGEGDLASLIIHEMVHSTIFIKDSSDFNENLASFIGDTAAYYFLANKYGKNSKEYFQYLHEDQDYRTYSRHILGGTKSLDSLYQSFSPSESFDSKKEMKKQMIQKIVKNIDTLSLFEKRKTTDWLPNNTYFMSFHLYQSKQKDFGKELDLKFKGNLKAYIRYLGKSYNLKM